MLFKSALKASNCFLRAFDFPNATPEIVPVPVVDTINDYIRQIVRGSSGFRQENCDSNNRWYRDGNRLTQLLHCEIC